MWNNIFVSALLKATLTLVLMLASSFFPPLLCRTSYYGTAFVGYLGLLTGMRPGGWSVSVDERDQNGTSFEV